MIVSTRSVSYRLCSLILVVLFFPAVMAVASSNIHSIKLLSPQVGFAANSDDLYWTTDAGNHWDKRTPVTATKDVIADVFFLNTSMGWVLLSHEDENDQTLFDLATTDNAGNTWQVSRVEVPDRTPYDYSGRGSMYFLDRLHGWINLRIYSGSAVRPGAMLSTDDGGASWRYTLGDSGAAGSFCFFNLQDGVLSGGPANSELYVTHDGSTSWQEVSLKNSQVLLADEPTYGTPTCDGSRGYLPVTFSGREGTKSALVLFETSDAGHAFLPDRVLPDLDETSPGQEITTALADSHLIALSAAGNDVVLSLLPSRSDKVSATFHVGGAAFAVLRASFATSSQGWALTSSGLLLTTDGGGTWIDITPTELRRAAVPLGSLAAASPIPNGAIPNGNGITGRPATSAGAVKNTRMGFDISKVVTTSQMSILWQYSPYFETSLYLLNAPGRNNDKNLTATWVNAVVRQGWGFVPTWFGPQAPLGCALPLKKPPKYKAYIITNDSNNTPYMQGQASATAATNSLNTLNKQLAGLPSTTQIGPIIYYNMENYNNLNVSGCSTPVIQFLNGWVNVMQANTYKAGVYTSVFSAAQDLPQVSPAPDDVWITLANATTPVSIWGLEFGKTILCDPFAKQSCTLWQNQQRMHQFIVDDSETWGVGTANPVTLPMVDRDVVNADVAISSTGAKPYAFQYVILNYPGATLTEAYGINNVGTVVGTYTDSANKQHGFTYQNGNYASYDYPGASTTELYGINDAGQIVGVYYNANGLSGFLLSNNVPTPISLRKDFNNQPLAVNDDGQVIGNYGTQNVGGLTTFFLMNTKNARKITPVNCYCNVDSIDGDANVYGVQYPPSQPQTAFLYNAVSGVFTTLPNAPESGGPSGGVNDNLQIASLTVLYDYPAGVQITVEPPATYESGSYANGINDYGEIVGFWTDSNFVTHGYLACPTGFPSGCSLP